MALNNPFDIWFAINLMRGTPYEKYLAIELRKNTVVRDNVSETEMKVFKQMAEMYKLNYEELKKVQSWKEFDEKFSVKVHPNFPNIEDYYKVSSCKYNLHLVKKPTLIIHSKDDPIIPLKCLPLEECISNEKFIVGIVKKGGHVGYFQGVTGQKRWYPYVSAEYLDAVFELNQLKKLKPVD